MSDKKRPEIIAYTSELMIIPFENIQAVDGDTDSMCGSMRDYVDDTYPENTTIEIFIKKCPKVFRLDDDEAKKFLDQYNNYLAFVETCTIHEVGNGKEV